MELTEKITGIARAVRRAGGRAMLVGGCVRDRIIGMPVKDCDMEIYGISPEKLLSVLRGIVEVDSVGMNFGVLKVRHLPIDLSLPRRENRSGRGHRGFAVSVDPVMDFAEASARRDFTVNAIMEDALTGEIVDPHHGREDLRRGILRHVSAAFSEDPLRVLRGMQFIARFRLTPAPETVALCARLTQEELPRERIAAEWEKMLLQGTAVSAGLEFLARCNWVKFYPELDALRDCPQDPRWHPEGSVWTHTLLATDAAAAMRRGTPDDLVLMLAVLCHDFGKPETTSVTPEGRIVSPGHDTCTAPAERFITAIWNRRDLPLKVLPLIAGHMHPWQLAAGDSSDRAYRRLAMSAGRLDLLADVAEADVRGIAMSESDRAERLGTIDRFRRRCAELAVADARPEPLLRGRHLLAHGLTPGRAFKPILDRCFDAQLSGEFDDLPGALAYLEALLASAPPGAGEGAQEPSCGK